MPHIIPLSLSCQLSETKLAEVTDDTCQQIDSCCKELICLHD